MNGYKNLYRKNPMKKTKLTTIVLLLGLMALTSTATLADSNDTHHRIQFKDTGEALVNPGMGWTLHYYSNIITNYGSRLAPSDTLDDFPGLSVIYLRVPWSFLEPEEGRFDWSLVDTPAQRWIDKGKQVAFRVTCSESWMRYATPKWVEAAGAKGHNFTVGKGVDPDGPYWEPNYDDPVLLAKLDQFLTAMAKRYEDNPNVAFIDVGSYGVWGEGHTWASTQLPVDDANENQAYRPLLEAFPQNPTRRQRRLYWP